MSEGVSSQKVLYAFVALVAAVSPFAALADAGTPLVWGTGFHLFIGNLIIGLAEGEMLRHLFLPKRRLLTCVILMTAANYFSAWLGMAMIMEWWRPLVSQVGVEMLTTAFWCSVVVAWLFTIAAEAPFVWMAFCRESHGVRRAVKASLVIQSASYAVLFLLYSGCSRNSLMSVDVVDFETIAVPENVMVGFVGDDGEKYMGDLRLRNWTKIDASAFEVVASSSFLPSGRPSYGNVIKVAEECDLKWRPVIVFGDVIGLAYHGKGALDEKQSGESFGFELETPCISLMLSSITQLPDGKAIFQLGENQICIADPERKCIAVVARGKNPAVMLKDTNRTRH